MKRIKCTALLAVAISLLLAGCDSDSVTQPALGALVTPAPPAPPLVWDEANWDEVSWQ